MCPDWELNWALFGSQASTQSTEPHQPGLKLTIFIVKISKFLASSHVDEDVPEPDAPCARPYARSFLPWCPDAPVRESSIIVVIHHHLIL